jgi:uncharacterized protein (TIGR02246 family)
MTTEQSKAVDQSEIRRFIAQHVEAVRAKDIDTLVSHYARDVRSFDVVNQLQSAGTDAIRKRLQEWFSTFRGPLGFEIHDLDIVTGHDVAFCYGVSGVSATTKNETKLNMWYRTTICCRKINGNWSIAHEHDSVPFDAASGQASLDLKP